MSQDGWVRDIMNPLMDAEYRFSAVYWVVVVALLVFLILNLFVAVVTTSFARVREDPNKDSAFSADFSAGWTNTVSSVKSRSRGVGSFARRGLAAACVPTPLSLPYPLSPLLTARPSPRRDQRLCAGAALWLVVDQASGHDGRGRCVCPPPRAL